MWQRASDSGSVIHSWYCSVMAWLLCGQWPRIRRHISDFCSKHPIVEIALHLLILPPVLVLFYAAAAVDWIFEACQVVPANEPGVDLLKEHEIRRRVKKRGIRDSVKELPLVRHRALTLRSGQVDCDDGLKEKVPDRGGKRVDQRTVDQLGTCALWRFPLEVRECIWKYVVSGNHIHIVKRRGRLGNVYCSAQDPTDPVHRDFCARSDEQGFYVPSAWPRDRRPLALLVSCRQIYSECIDILYSHNTFAFDDPALVSSFLTSLLPRRRKLVASFHLAPAVGPRCSGYNFRHFYNVAYQPSQDHTIHHLGYVLNVIAQQPRLHSVTITPKLGLAFEAKGDAPLHTFMKNFTHALNKIEASKPIALAWPEDPGARIAPFTQNLSEHWGRDQYLPPQDQRNFAIRTMPWQSSTEFMAFFIPFDVQCLHCASYTLIRRATKGFAEVSYHTLALDFYIPNSTTISDVLMRYWTFHGSCGGWIEFQYHGGRKKWSVAQGAQRVSEEETDRHVKEHEDRYPKMENPHERLMGMSVRDVVAKPSPPRAYPWNLTTMTHKAIDEPTREAYYRNVGWHRE
ncbi:hypothetical protein BU23DRAFT_601496 [Bimuria novae-zelandiae CBS 107.79]|uniref:DUF7730 domain-containing protein n=1 Tax=Bimuria novae-zelandiae CBS 107.79 TaxID=1447943 RepID=A0A6A5UYM7_9PLEO|nr:hypothetical protein BU23DRAFT_601496 [Bimuria novae-zelandiae CBS 107.79]